MKSVKRYDGKIEHCDNGGYVTFADYKKLEARLENAEGRERKHCKRAETAEAELERLKAQEPFGYIDPESLREYRGVRAGGSWSHSVKTGEYNQTMPIYAEPRPAVLPEKMPPTVWQVLYDECGGFVDCTPEPQKIWDAFRKFAGGEIAE